MSGSPVYSEALKWTWRETAVRQGILCLVCSQVPSLEHRAEFYDTGLCEDCTRELLSREKAPPTP
jgi:hypothetical protein